MAAPGPYEIARQLSLIKLLEVLLTREHAKLNEMAAVLPPGSSLPAEYGGERLALVSVPKASDSVSVDERELLPWVKKYFPGDVIKSEHVSPTLVTALKKHAKTYGGWLNREDGTVTPIAGITVAKGEGAGTPRVSLSGSAEQVAARAYQRGEISFAALLALDAPAEEEE